MPRTLEPLNIYAGQAALLFFWYLFYKNQGLLHIIIWFIFFSGKLSTLFCPGKGNLYLIHCGILSDQNTFWSIADDVLGHDKLL